MNGKKMSGTYCITRIKAESKYVMYIQSQFVTGADKQDQHQTQAIQSLLASVSQSQGKPWGVVECTHTQTHTNAYIDTWKMMDLFWKLVSPTFILHLEWQWAMTFLSTCIIIIIIIIIIINAISNKTVADKLTSWYSYMFVCASCDSSSNIIFLHFLIGQ